MGEEVVGEEVVGEEAVGRMLLGPYRAPGTGLLGQGQMPC